MATLQGAPAATAWPPLGAQYQFYPVASANTADRPSPSYAYQVDDTPTHGHAQHGPMPQSSGDTLALEHHPDLHEEAASKLASGRALQADLLQLEEVVPWKAVAVRWRTQRARWRRTLHSPHLAPGTIARCVEEFHAALAVRPGTSLQFCGHAWEVLLHNCMHSGHRSPDALHAVVRDFQQGVHAWLGPHIEAVPSSPSTPYMPVGDFHPQDDRHEGEAVEGTWGRGATPPPSPFSAPAQQQVDPSVAERVKGMMNQVGVFRDDSAKQPRVGDQRIILDKGRLHGTDSEETDLEDY